MITLDCRAQTNSIKNHRPPSQRKPERIVLSSIPLHPSPHRKTPRQLRSASPLFPILPLPPLSPLPPLLQQSTLNRCKSPHPTLRRPTRQRPPPHILQRRSKKYLLHRPLHIPPHSLQPATLPLHAHGPEPFLRMRAARFRK